MFCGPEISDRRKYGPLGVRRKRPPEFPYIVRLRVLLGASWMDHYIWWGSKVIIQKQKNLSVIIKKRRRLFVGPGVQFAQKNVKFVIIQKMV